MAEIINLRRARKQRARSEKEKVAADNRLKHGRPKAERRVTEMERVRAERDLSGKRLFSRDENGSSDALSLSSGAARSECTVNRCRALLGARPWLPWPPLFSV